MVMMDFFNWWWFPTNWADPWGTATGTRPSARTARRQLDRLELPYSHRSRKAESAEPSREIPSWVMHFPPTMTEFPWLSLASAFALFLVLGNLVAFSFPIFLLSRWWVRISPVCLRFCVLARFLSSRLSLLANIWLLLSGWLSYETNLIDCEALLWLEGAVLVSQNIPKHANKGW